MSVGPPLHPRLSALRAPAFLEVTRRAAELRAAGRPVLSLAFGEPGFDPPAAARDAAVRLIQQGDVRYTSMDGLEPLRTAIAERIGARRRLPLGPENVVVCVGATQAISSAVRATVKSGDEVVVPAPYWPPYVDVVGLAGGRPVCPRGRPEHGFKLTAERLRRSLSARTRWLFLNSPNNPSGAVYSAAELSALAEVLRDFPWVGVISDEIYEDLAFQGWAPSLLDVAPDLADRTLIVGGMSKGFAMTGFRIGWAVGPKRLVRAVTWLQALSTFTPPAVGQAAALAALTACEQPAVAERARLRERCAVVVRRLLAGTALRITPPEGAFYLLCDARAYIDGARAGAPSDDTALALALLERAEVATMPGGAFGLDGYLRLAFGGPDAEVDEAVERLVAALAAMASRAYPRQTFASAPT